MASIVFCVKRFSINGIENERYMVTIRNPLCFYVQTSCDLCHQNHVQRFRMVTKEKY